MVPGGRDEGGPVLVVSAVWVTAVAGLVLLHPEAVTVRSGGARAQESPGRGTRVGASVLVAVGLTLAVGAVVWRVTGGVFESPLEDDVFSLVYLGLAWAAGGWSVRSGRAGWRILAVILMLSVAYAVVGAVSLALA